jgi:hypothetical protein
VRHLAAIEAGEVFAHLRPGPKWPSNYPPTHWSELPYTLRSLARFTLRDAHVGSPVAERSWKRGPNGEPRWLSPLFATACGARVRQEDLCRETYRRRGNQQLAPLPEFCSPSCGMCSVILDAVEIREEARDEA